MQLLQPSKHHRFPVSIISPAVWRYQRFNDSYRDVKEELAYRNVIVIHEAIRSWCNKFASHFKEVIMKREHKPKDNRVENAHQPTRRKEKSLIKFKAPQGVQTTLSLMGKGKNIFAINVGRYTKNVINQRLGFNVAKAICYEADQRLFAA